MNALDAVTRHGGRRVRMPSARTGRTWWAALRRTPVTAWNDNVTDWAASLTYYAVLALFPVMLVVVSVIGLSMPHATPDVVRQVTGLFPAQSRGLVSAVLDQLTQQRSTAWVLVGVGGVSSLWSGSSYLAVFRRALHAIHHQSAARPVRQTAVRILLTAFALLALLLGSAVALLLTGGLARVLGRLLHIGQAPMAAWAALRWPAMLGIAVVLVLVLYRSGPRDSRPVRRMAPGGTLAVALLLVVSFGFSLYAAHVTTYHRLYGSLAGFVLFLIWLWLSNLALLLGALFNAELARAGAGRGAAWRSMAG
ncbi:YihY/virulence factor BrkB family protein [Streptantibioticus parmotrematis]|uniref:YihY/virulence factor BrkB family protein n=1 Tax=Streptantibioticus parmotrematis TaxID=2873249 RepID=UPI0033F82B13